MIWGHHWQPRFVRIDREAGSRGGGARVWKVLLNHTAIEILNEAMARLLPIRCAVCNPRMTRDAMTLMPGRTKPLIAQTISLVVMLAALCVLGTATPAFASDKLHAHSFRMAADASRARIVLHFDREPELRWFLLDNPKRLVIDLPETGFSIAAEETEPRGMISGVQFGNVGATASRLIVTADSAFTVDDLAILANENSAGVRLVADLGAASPERFHSAMAEQAMTTASTRSTPKTDRLGSMERDLQRPFTIVIDPGHGGIDIGAEGVTGTLEKTITLAFALELRKQLEDTGRYAVFMTREDDRFLRLDERVRTARQHSADLFMSIHADTVRQRGVRGATVYTLSDRASDAEAAALAARENLADELAGLSVEDTNHEVSDILMDLIRRETHSFSIRFARTLVGQMSDRLDLIKNPHRFAGFRVLRAPDVPSVLIELGYLSNPEDERQLKSAEWRRTAVDSIVEAIEKFASAHAQAGG